MLDPEACSRTRLAVSLLVNQKGTDREKAKQIWRYILEYEIASGTRYMVTVPDGVVYMITGTGNRLMTIPRQGRGGNKVFAYLHELYGISEHDSLMRHIHDSLRGWAESHGEHVEMRRLSAYSQQTRTAYVSDYAGGMWRITGDDEIINIPNGEDDVFFANDDGGIHVVPDFNNTDGIDVVEELIDINFMEGLGGATAAQQKMALTVWLFAVCLPDLLPTKPILLIEGVKGSGKSATIQRIQLVLQGAIKPIILSKNKEGDFGILLLRSPIAMLDNLDSYIDWLPDSMGAYTTLGQFPRRKLYTDDEEVVVKPHAFIAVTTRNPSSFRRDDIADRCLVLRLERRLGFKRFQAIQEDIANRRPRLFAAYLKLLNQIIREIRNGALEDAPESEVHRMADFAALARVVGRIMHWEEADVAAMMEALQSERDAFINEEDPLVELLHRWIVYRPKGQTNIGREIGLSVLYAELESLAQSNNTEKGWYKSPRLLAQNIRAGHVLKDFRIEMRGNGGHKLYRIWRHTDPPLNLISGGLDEEKTEL